MDVRTLGLFGGVLVLLGIALALWIVLQAYRRDMGGGVFAMMKDVSAPVMVNVGIYELSGGSGGHRGRGGHHLDQLAHHLAPIRHPHEDVEDRGAGLGLPGGDEGKQAIGELRPLPRGGGGEGLHEVLLGRVLHQRELLDQARAAIAGRHYVVPDDVKAMLHDVVRHRIAISYRAEAEGLNSDALLDRIVERVPINDAGAPHAAALD